MKSKIVEANEKIAEEVTSGFSKIQDGVVNGYKRIEDGVVEGFSRRKNVSKEKPENILNKIAGDKNEKENSDFYNYCNYGSRLCFCRF